MTPMNNNSSIKDSLIGIVILIILFYAGTSTFSFLRTKYDKWKSGEKEIPWQGTNKLQVCKKPYYSSDGCYMLMVNLDKKYKEGIIYFPNGGYIQVSDIICYKAARVSDDEPEYTFCRTYDENGEQWDLMPTWINY